MESKNLRVLVIDDEPSILAAVRMCLRSTGWTLYLAAKAREGAELARQERPDVIVCDVVMPEMSGRQLLWELKQDPATAHIPFVFMSGAERCFDAAGFLEKPFGPHELRHVIESVLSPGEYEPPGREPCRRTNLPGSITRRSRR